MKVLVATREGQGSRPKDFSFAVDDELVQLAFVCDTDQEDPDNGCGCGRAFTGLNSHKGTTTALVADLPLDREDFILALGSSLHQSGWHSDELSQAARAEVEEDVDELLTLASEWPVGTVLERRLDDIRPRVLT